MHIRLTRGKNRDTATAIRTVYDREKKRGTQIILGSFSPYTMQITDADLPMATTEEFEEAVAWLAEQKIERENARRVYFANALIDSAGKIIHAIEEGDKSIWTTCSPDALQTALEGLIGAMRKAKLWSPTRKTAKPVEHASNAGFMHAADQIILPGFLNVNGAEENS